LLRRARMGEAGAGAAGRGLLADAIECAEDQSGKKLRGLPTSQSNPVMHSALTRIVSVGEEFHRSTLSRAVERRLPAGHVMVEALWDRTVRDIDTTWGKQLNAWNEWVAVNVEHSAEYRAFHPFVDARNAATQGLGRLTRLQVARDGGRAVRTRLDAAGIYQSGSDILIDTATVRSCATVATDFIDWLDRQERALG
jgi:hypothetical protein